MLLVSQRGTFTGGPAGNQKIDPRLNLTLDQPVKRPFVQRTIAPEWCDKGRARASKTCASKHVAPSRVTDFDCRLGLAAWDAVSERPQLNSPRISRNSKTPFLPASHRAARKAPRAKPSRLRA